MEIVEGEMHDGLTAIYQTLEMARLNEVLKKFVRDGKVRKEICAEYFFDTGYFIDSCWLADKGQRFRPGYCFTELTKENEETGKVFVAAPEFGTCLHEYAHGAANWFFDDRKEDISEIETGDVNMEE